ncbi:hypothetical protein GCHA_0470 [Paraglaciecola chathamensis S18K6]|uniref:Uncharacterized protein n=1 Tax=Paraglaciecola chathamensis S18K6 TaxID=1127672 RepID=A0AAV3UTI0_9ALTE|nr:hypothetical protein GCHA_0470 [Paraglaciecola chathamensis S18K6]
MLAVYRQRKKALYSQKAPVSKACLQVLPLTDSVAKLAHI